MQRAVTIPRAILDFLDAFSLSVVVIYVIRVVDLSPGLMGLAFALSAVGFVVGSTIAPRFQRRFGIDGAILWVSRWSPSAPTRWSRRTASFPIG